MLITSLLMLSAAIALFVFKKPIAKRLTYYTVYAMSDKQERKRLTAHKEEIYQELDSK